jgi:parallel beta-helix repeat protein
LYDSPNSNFEIPDLPEGYHWNRDENGYVIGTLSTGGTDNDGVHHTASVPIKISNVPNTFITQGNLTADTTFWCGDISLTGTVTVPSGKVLIVSQTSLIKFPNNSSLIVYGKLNANGCTFSSQSNSNPGSWGNIQINGSGASGTTISNASIFYGTEIDVINADNVTVQNNEIINSSGYGLHFYGGTGCQAINNTISNSNIYHGVDIEGNATVDCANNTITKNSPNTGRGVGILYAGGTSGTATRNDISGWSWGIGAIWGASVNSLRSSYSPDYNNRIRNCYYGIVVYRGAVANFGVPYDLRFTKNSIYSNVYDNASVGISYPDYSSTLYGTNDWWGDAPPDNSLLSVGPNAFFSPDYYLTSDPWEGLQKPMAGSVEAATTPPPGIGKTSVTSTNEDSLFQALELRLNKKYKEAKNLLVSFIAHHPDNQRAYIELYNCYSKETVNDIINFFNSLPSKASKDNELLLAGLYHRNGNIKMSKVVNNRIIAQNRNTSLAERAIINNAYIALYDENNIDEAVKIFKEALKQPELSTEMELENVREAIESYAKALGKQVGDLPAFGKSLAKENVIPKEYELFNNYPNPFNPTTTIRYGLPKDGFVTLKVYDILGREVATLVNEYEAAGSYIVTFNAGNLASGIYIYQLKSGGFVANKKLILMK